MSLPVNTGLGVVGSCLMIAGVLTGFAAAVVTAGGGVWISWNGVGGKMAPVCFARKFKMSSLRIRPSLPVPTTSLSFICEDRQTRNGSHKRQRHRTDCGDGLTLFSMARRLTAGVAWVLWPLISWWVCSSRAMAGVSTTSSSWITSERQKSAVSLKADRLQNETRFRCLT